MTARNVATLTTHGVSGIYPRSKGLAWSDNAASVVDLDLRSLTAKPVAPSVGELCGWRGRARVETSCRIVLAGSWCRKKSDHRVRRWPQAWSQ